MTQPETPATALEMREAQAKEWGTYVAKAPIDLDGVRAFNAGDPVPVSHVTNNIVSKDDVVKTGTQTAARLAENGT